MTKPLNVNPNRPHINIGKEVYEFEPREYIIQTLLGNYFYCAKDKEKVKGLVPKCELARLDEAEIARIDAEYDKVNIPSINSINTRFRLKLKKT